MCDDTCCYPKSLTQECYCVYSYMHLIKRIVLLYIKVNNFRLSREHLVFIHM